MVRDYEFLDMRPLTWLCPVLTRRLGGKRSKIIITSRRPLNARFTDPRVEFIALDFLNSPASIVEQIKELCGDVTHAFFTSYIHNNDFSKLHEKNGPLFRNYLEAVDQACPKLQRVVLQTGGKVRCDSSICRNQFFAPGLKDCNL